MLQSGLVLDATGAVLSQEVNLDLDSQGSTWTQEISDNTSGVGDTFPASPTFLEKILAIINQFKFFEGSENVTLKTMQY